LLQATPTVTEEKIRRIDEVLSGNFRQTFHTKIAAMREELKQEIANTSEPKNKERRERKPELLSGYY
jgi:hypothetical protein